MKKSSNLPSISRDVKEILDVLERQEGRDLRFYESVCKYSKRFLHFFTKDMKLESKMMKKIAWAKLRVTPSEWWAGFISLTMIPVLFSVFLAFTLFVSGSLMSHWYLPVFTLGLSGLLGTSFYYYPVSLADIEKTEAQSRAIETIMLLSFVLQNRTDLRGAAIFAGNASEGKLAEEIRDGLLNLDQKRDYDTVRELFIFIAHRWREIDEGIRRAIFDILRSTGQSEESLRRQDVSKAPERVINSCENQLGTKLDSIVMPTMTFMVFGSLAIVGVIGLSPIYGMIGMEFIDLKFFLLASGILIVSFLVFTILIERRRPVTLPPPRISPEDPRVYPEGKSKFFGKYVPIWVPSFILFLGISFPGLLYVSGIFTDIYLISGLNTFWFVWAVAASFSLYSHLRVGSRAEIREKVRKATRDWVIAFSTVGSRVIDGQPMKRAMKETSEIMSESKVGRQLEQATGTMDRLSVSMSYAFFKTGISKRIYNPLISSFLGVIIEIKKGSEEAAGEAAMLASEFLDTLAGVEKGFKQRIGEATGNLWLMAIVLLPVVSSLSVWIMDFMGEISLSASLSAEKAGLSDFPILIESMGSLEIAFLKLIMGLTVIALIVILVRHISVIRSGRDSIDFWNSLPFAVLLGTFLFTLSYWGFGLLKAAGI